MNVLSLFDGISCGQIALSRANLKYENYFASEIDKHAIKITQNNWPDTKQLGDITKINSQDLPKIDLLIGGSPCQGFSFAGKQLNFEDIRSKLFFEYVRLLKECRPKYFLLENVKMKKQSEDIISEILGVKPLKINSSLLSKQHRERLYWTNISNVTIPKDKKLEFNKLVWTRPHGWIKESTKNFTKSFVVTTRVANDFKIIEENGEKRKITPEECEELQTISRGYTSQVSDNQRYKCLGNCWTVDVISHILSFIPK